MIKANNKKVILRGDVATLLTELSLIITAFKDNKISKDLIQLSVELGLAENRKKFMFEKLNEQLKEMEKVLKINK